MQKDVIFKERLILRRNALNLTQMQLADKSGVSWRSISDYENDKSRPSHENTQKLARALGVTVGFLLGEENIIEGTVQERPKADLVGYSELPTDQLEKLFANMAAKLKTFRSHERKHVLGNLRIMIDELEERELAGPELSSEETAVEKAAKIFEAAKKDVGVGAEPSPPEASQHSADPEHSKAPRPSKPHSTKQS